MLLGGRLRTSTVFLLLVFGGAVALLILVRP
jgi:hypothetical protein